MVYSGMRSVVKEKNTCVGSLIHRTTLMLMLVSVILASCLSPGLPSTIEPPTEETPKRHTPPGFTPAAPTPTTPAHLRIDPQRLSGLHIQFWHPWTGNTAEAIEALVNTFNTSNEWGIRVNPTATGSLSVLGERMRAVFDNGEPAPNVVAASSLQLLAWQEDHALMINLDDYVTHPQWGLSEAELADITRQFWQEDTQENYRYGFPAQRMPHLLMYNRTWAQELGFPNPPTTLAEFRRQACAAARFNRSDDNTANDGTGGWIVSTSPASLLSWLAAFGVKNIPEQGANGYNFTSRQVNAAFTFLHGMYNEGCAWVSREPLPYEYFARRQALFYAATLEDSATQHATQERLGATDTWDVLAYPSLDGKPVVITSGLSYAIPAASAEEQLAAWLFVRWLAAPQRQARLIQVSHAYPINVSTISLMGDYLDEHPQWQPSLMWIPLSQPAPKHHSWGVVRFILEDAAWQIFLPSTETDQVAAILRQLDRTVTEVLEQRP